MPRKAPEFLLDFIIITAVVIVRGLIPVKSINFGNLRDNISDNMHRKRKRIFPRIRCIKVIHIQLRGGAIADTCDSSQAVVDPDKQVGMSGTTDKLSNIYDLQSGM